MIPVTGERPTSDDTPEFWTPRHLHLGGSKSVAVVLSSPSVLLLASAALRCALTYR